LQKPHENINGCFTRGCFTRGYIKLGHTVEKKKSYLVGWRYGSWPIHDLCNRS